MVRSVWTCELVLVAALAGCGSGESAMEAPDAAPPTDRLTVLLGQENAGVLVFSSELDGTLIDSSTINADGKASLLARDGGMISFLRFGAEVTSVVGIRTDQTLRWQERPGAPGANQTLALALDEVIGAESYEVYGCLDLDLAFEPPLTFELRATGSCLQAQSLPVFSFASDFDGLMSYGRLDVDMTGDIPGPVTPIWASDFASAPFELVVPGLTQAAYASPVLDYGDTRIQVPSHPVDMDEPTSLHPPGEAQELWMELTAYGPVFGAQVMQGPLPTDKTDWLSVPKGAVIGHRTGVAPNLNWLATGEGDLQSAEYFWESEQGFRVWQVFARPDQRLAKFPQLPAEVAANFGADLAPSFGFFFLDVLDYKDLDGFDAAMEAGRLSWTPFGPETAEFLLGGGQIATATTYANVETMAPFRSSDSSFERAGSAPDLEATRRLRQKRRNRAKIRRRRRPIRHESGIRHRRDRVPL